MTHQTTITWHRPSEKRPPFYKEILAVLGGGETKGGPWRDYNEFIHLKVCETDLDGNRYEGIMMAHRLEKGEYDWSDVQFLLRSRDGEELSWYSDSIEWWAEPPEMPV